MLETESGDDLVVLRPQWLAGELLGRLLSQETLQRAPPGGLFSARELTRLLELPALHSHALLELLAALELSTPHTTLIATSTSAHKHECSTTSDGESVRVDVDVEAAVGVYSRSGTGGIDDDDERSGAGARDGGQWALLRRISRLSLSSPAANSQQPSIATGADDSLRATRASNSREDATKGDGALHELMALNTQEASPPQTAVGSACGAARFQTQEACAHVGMQYRSSFQQLLHLFTRIQTRLRRHVLQLAGDADASDDEDEDKNDNGEEEVVFENRASMSRTSGSPPDLHERPDRQADNTKELRNSRRFELTQWHNGSRLWCVELSPTKLETGTLMSGNEEPPSLQNESLLVEFSLSMIESYDIVELCARVPKWRLADARTAHAIFQLHVDLLGLIERTVCDACPNIELEKYVLSAKELRSREALQSSTTRQMRSTQAAASGISGRAIECYQYAGSNARPIKKVHQTAIFRQLFETRTINSSNNNNNSALCSATVSPGYSMSDLQLSDSSSSLQNALSPRAAAPIRIRELDEPIDELLCFGSEELLTHLKFGTELHASSIPRLVLQKLCAIFDRCDPLTGRWALTSSSSPAPGGCSSSFYSSGASSGISGGTFALSGGAASEQCGWPLLARALDLSAELVAQLEESSACSLARSCTWLALDHWARSPRATVRKLLEHLHALQQRPDPSHPQLQAQAEEAVQLVYHYSPLFVYTAASLATESECSAQVTQRDSNPHLQHRVRRRQRRSTTSALSESDDDSTLAQNASSDEDSEDDFNDSALDQTTASVK